jgi:hypothetical protein
MTAHQASELPPDIERALKHVDTLRVLIRDDTKDWARGVRDGVLIALRDIASALADRAQEPDQDERAIRRMLCAAVIGPLAYMDDGEASGDGIDFLRDSAAVIDAKMRERNLRRAAQDEPSADARDAARYRWLRGNYFHVEAPCVDLHGVRDFNDPGECAALDAEIDSMLAAIDRAREAAKGE